MVTATVDLEDVRSYRGASLSRGMQVCVRVCVCMCVCVCVCVCVYVHMCILSVHVCNT